MRKLSVLATVVTAIALITAACTPGGPPLNNWKVKPVSIKVVQQEEFDAGDEPYVIQVGFRSKLAVPNSSQTSIASQCYSQALPAPDSVPNGATEIIPPNSADISFPNAQNLDLGDVLLNTAPFEIFGTLTFAVERDGLFSGCAVSDLLSSALLGPLRDALNILIAGSAVPPTEQQLVDLIVNNLGNFLQAAASFIGSIIEGLGNPDDIIGVAAQIHLPTKGAFTDLLNAGLGLADLLSGGQIGGQGNINIPDLPGGFKIKVGKLLPSTATFDFDTGGAHYILDTAVA